MDSLDLLTDLADLDDLMFSLDLASGYHQVDMDPRYYTYLGFQWEGKILCFQSPSFRSCFCPLVLHKNYENHLFIPVLSGGPAYKLLG